MTSRMVGGTFSEKGTNDSPVLLVKHILSVSIETKKMA